MRAWRSRAVAPGRSFTWKRPPTRSALGLALPCSTLGAQPATAFCDDPNFSTGFRCGGGVGDGQQRH